jgi:signal peptidase I
MSFGIRLVGIRLVGMTASDGGSDPPARSVGRTKTRRYVTWVTTIALVLGWFIFLRPDILGGSTAYVLVSGDSMKPTLEDGDFVIARRQDVYGEGDIAVYRIPEGDVGAGSLIIHRIVGGSAEDGYILRGDNRTTDDLWRPQPDDIAGKLWLYIPAVGKAIPYLRSPLVVALFAAIMAFLFIFNLGSGRTEEKAP